MYIGTSGATTDYILLSENSNTYKLVSNGYVRTRNTVTLSPVAIETDDDVIYSDYLYTASQIKDCNTNTAFELDGHEYLTLGFGRTTNSKAIVVIRLY